ncbi:hypothetical protein ACHHYP_06917 [Achlya hypogyna]|uniref:Uncharacterized protein n=1 Tax=Achlya hypogyna TaxID=1202772 RepID=A0A1V9ZN24_ACHHY|nr:hypothetical protein ACHHYP_06917 [Achlya hypogyna]
MATTNMQASGQSRSTEAQEIFSRVVKAELAILLEDHVPRPVAVKILLQRIVKDMVEPSDAEVRKVMVQFQLSREDAVRALIVKQELGRLKLRGLDSLAAIEELTRKMQRKLPLSPRLVHEDNETEEERNHDMAPPVANPTDSETERGADPSLVFHAVDACPSPESGKRKLKNSAIDVSPRTGTALSTPESSTTYDSPSWREVSLCQQIDNVRISASPSKESEATAAAIVDSPLVKITRKRRNPSSDADVPKAVRFGKNKKARLDVDSKLKAQVESKLKAQAGDAFVLVKAPVKASKRSRPKSDTAADAPYAPKKARVD